MASRRAIGLAALITAPMVAAVLGWAAVVYVKVGHFTMSTQSGLSLVNHSIFFIEDAPARYAQVRDILLEYRAKRIAEVGHPGNTMWSALPAIREATGWSLPEASRELQKMSVQMFLEHRCATPLAWRAHGWSSGPCRDGRRHRRSAVVG